eukprot:CAMPEP_0172715818 /NCGR_PEP_ID=MMETSP1074-20121228/67765_1 /TAXON_ID=2916 /ORGANISM="Ceratium fusus, Strain PA161109" /LENGTH=306 /DNA_ID=CAMNT_0013540437 /DNA_START=95 /DNA_END=1015 /DNA_ORIENTATION=-
MGLLSPAPTVLGACSLTGAVETVCAVHLCVCIFILAQVDSAQAITVAGVTVSPSFQCITAAWCLLGVPLIIHGGIGAIYCVEGHLTTYMYYLAATMGWAGAWLVLFLRYGNTCSTLHPTTNDGRSTASFVCGISNGMVIFWMLALLGAIAAGVYLVWSMKEYCKKRLEMELIRYQEPWQVVQALADDVAAEQAMEAKAAVNMHLTKGEGFAMAAPLQPYPMPPAMYGSAGHPQSITVAVPKGAVGPSRNVADGGQLFSMMDRNRDGQIDMAEAQQGLAMMASSRNCASIGMQEFGSAVPQSMQVNH